MQLIAALDCNQTLMYHLHLGVRRRDDDFRFRRNRHGRAVLVAYNRRLQLRRALRKRRHIAVRVDGRNGRVFQFILNSSLRGRRKHNRFRLARQTLRDFVFRRAEHDSLGRIRHGDGAKRALLAVVGSRLHARLALGKRANLNGERIVTHRFDGQNLRVLNSPTNRACGARQRRRQLQRFAFGDGRGRLAQRHLCGRFRDGNLHLQRLAVAFRNGDGG